MAASQKRPERGAAVAVARGGQEVLLTGPELGFNTGIGERFELPAMPPGQGIKRAVIC